MFGQDENQQDQQHNDNQHVDNNNQGQQEHNPAAPPPDHEFAPPKPAYEDAVFGGDDNQPTGDDAPAPDAAGDTTPANPGPTAPAPAPVQDDNLLGIKKQALEQLSPLVGQLEQSPEEKFHTTMRIIQASDNHSLINDAYQAAQNIEDDKARAQALLDIINEINYFTNGDENPAESAQAEQQAL